MEKTRVQPRKQMRCEIGCGEHRQALWNLNILGNLQMACCSTGVEGSGSNIPSGFLKQGTLTGGDLQTGRVGST